jgi:hypothetical protein
MKLIVLVTSQFIASTQAKEDLSFSFRRLTFFGATSEVSSEARVGTARPGLAIRASSSHPTV